MRRDKPSDEECRTKIVEMLKYRDLLGVIPMRHGQARFNSMHERIELPIGMALPL